MSLADRRELSVRQLEVPNTEDVKKFHAPSHKGSFASQTVEVTCDNLYDVLTEETIEEYGNIFDMLDEDLGGTLTEIELRRGFRDMGISMTKKEMHDLVLEIDENSDGEISFEEFAVMLHRLSQKEKHGFDAEFVEENVVSENDFIRTVLSVRSTIWDLMDNPESSGLAQFITFFVLATIGVSCTFFVLESDPLFHKSDYWVPIFKNIEAVCVYIFTVEYLLRFTCTPDYYAFIFNGLNTVDLIAILPFYIELGLGSAGSAGGSDVLRIVRLVRIFRIFKVSRYVTWILVFGEALQESIAPLAMFLFVFGIYIVFASALIYFFEKGEYNEELQLWINENNQVSQFQSIPMSMWFCVITMCTIGYGDMFPITTMGYVISSISAIVGVILLAIPISVLSANFKAAYGRMISKMAIAADQREKMKKFDEWKHKEKHLAKAENMVVARSDERHNKPASPVHVLAEHNARHTVFLSSIFESIRNNQRLMLSKAKKAEEHNRDVFLVGMSEILDDWKQFRANALLKRQ